MVPALVAGYHALTSVHEWDQFEVVQSKRNNQVVANAMDFTAKRIYMATAGLSQGLKKTSGHFSEMFMGQRRGLCRGRAGGNTLVGLHYETCSNRKIMFRNNIVCVAALRLHQATKSVEYLGDCCWFLNVYFSIFLRQTPPQGTTRDSSKFR